MYISHLNLKNYRNYTELELDVPTGLVLFTGSNGQGKSNLLEAFYLLSISKSYRATNDREALLINRGLVSNDCHILGLIQKEYDQMRVVIDMRLAPSVGELGATTLMKDISIDGQKVSASTLISAVRAVIFSVQDIDLISGSPAVRRRFLDILISRFDRHYLRSLQKYQRVIYQRNHLLRFIKEHKASISELEFWNDSMIEEGSYIIHRRHSVIEELSSNVVSLYRDLGNSKEDIAVNYSPSLILQNYDIDMIKSDFTFVLKSEIEKDIALGSTQRGPHRDDLNIFIDDKKASAYASRGQARTLALSMKLGEGDFLAKETGEYPVIILDDVFSELDSSRREQLLHYISKSEQVLISCNGNDMIPSHLLEGSKIFLIENGMVNLLK